MQERMREKIEGEGLKTRVKKAKSFVCGVIASITNNKLVVEPMHESPRILRIYLSIRMFNDVIMPTSTLGKRISVMNKLFQSYRILPSIQSLLSM